ncbi:MAG: DUF3570 domain-containing protein [Verrucomicrobiaceae bacterium]
MATSASEGQDVLRYKYQYYDEENGRIDVVSHYLDYKHSWLQSNGWDKTTLGLRLAVDSLSGQTPTGTHANRDPDDWQFQQIEDERYVTIVTLEHEMEDHTLTFEYARSEEDDYLSNALAAKWRSEFFEKNTTVTAGVSVALDKVKAAGFLVQEENKDALDLTLGVSQLMGTRTILDVTMGYGHTKGFLADPYRAISQVFNPGGFHIPAPENRPGEQDRWVLKVAGRHYFPGVDAALAPSYRFFANSDGLVGHTFEVKWIQQVTDELSVTPYVRYYRQGAADYYYPTLTGQNFAGFQAIQGQAPFFSPDYRLSAFEAATAGVKFTFEATEELAVDFKIERYEMFGRSAGTPDIFFPKANVITLGVNYEF